MSESKRSPSSETSTSIDKDDADIPAAKRARSSQADDNDDDKDTKNTAKQTMDLATVFGLNDGDRIEVAWQVHDDNDGDKEEEIHWWGATLLPWNKKDIVDETVAVRTLCYDAYPAKGFTEESMEQVVFLGENLLADPNSNEELNFRRPGEEFTSEGTIERVDPAALVEQTLSRVLKKHGKLLRELPAAQQAVIASQVATRREQLVEHLKANPGIVTKNKMQEILASVWKGEPPKTS